MENKASLAKEAFIWPLPITSALHDILIGFHQYLISIRPHMPSKFLHIQMFSSSPFSKIPPRPLVWSGCSLSLISQAQFLPVLLSPVPTSSKNQLIPFCSGVHPESKNGMH